MKKILLGSVLSISIGAMAAEFSRFNEATIRSIKFQKTVYIHPGTSKTMLSNMPYNECFLLHDKSDRTRYLYSGSEFPVVENTTATTSYSSWGRSGVAIIEFAGLESATYISCKNSNIAENDLMLFHVENQLANSVLINLDDVKEIQ